MAQPVCNSECQKQKQIDGLLLSLQNAEKTKSSDPQGYEQARINYYSLKDGQGWLRQEKERLAKDEVQPVLTKLSQEYNSLKAQLNQKSDANEYAKMTKAQQITEESQSDFLTRELQKVSDRVDVSQRLSELGGGQFKSSWMPIILDVIIALLSLSVLYTALFTNKIKRFFISTS